MNYWYYCTELDTRAKGPTNSLLGVRRKENTSINHSLTTTSCSSGVRKGLFKKIS